MNVICASLPKLPTAACSAAVASAFARLLRHIESGGSTSCIKWTGHVCNGGYGRIRVGSVVRAAHRIAYTACVGAIPEGLHLDHLCRNRSCVNPAHLEPVPGRVNYLRGIGFPAVNAAKTHCLRGHSFADDGYYKSKNPTGYSRRCKLCHKARVIACRERAR